MSSEFCSTCSVDQTNYDKNRHKEFDLYQDDMILGI